MIFDKLAGCHYFSKLDLRWAYYQVRVAEADVHKTTFRSPLGSFASRVMSMGLANAAPTFQRLMDSIFGDLPWVSAYLDDLLIASRTAEEHLHHISIIQLYLTGCGSTNYMHVSPSVHSFCLRSTSWGSYFLRKGGGLIPAKQKLFVFCLRPKQCMIFSVGWELSITTARIFPGMPS